jgi:hypothetical protein
MKFKNYCIAVLGNTKNVKSEIKNISEGDVRYADGTGLLLCTFQSVATAGELTEYFQSNNRSFLLFELGKDNYGAFLAKENLHNQLFGHMKENGHDIVSLMTDKIMSDIMKTNIAEPEFVLDVDKMSDDEITETLNNILDKGYDNLTDDDKIILEKLRKK